MLPKQLDDLIQLFVVAVAVHENFKLRVAPLGFPGLYVHEVDVVFLRETQSIFLKLSNHVLRRNSIPNGIFRDRTQPYSCVHDE